MYFSIRKLNHNYSFSLQQMQLMQYYAPEANGPPSAVLENNADVIPSENGTAGSALNKANEHMVVEENGDANDTIISNKMEEDTVNAKDDIMQEGNMTGQGNAEGDMTTKDTKGEEHPNAKEKMEEDNAVLKDEMTEENAESKDKMVEE
jgi:intron-binding protein aquarius